MIHSILLAIVVATRRATLLAAVASILVATILPGRALGADAPAGASAAAPPTAAHPPAAQAAPPAAQAAPPPAALAPPDASYLIGVNFGGQLRRLGINDAVTLEGLSRGMKDGLAGKKTTPEDQRRLQDFVHAAVDAAVARNLDAAREYLARNGREKGVKTTPSGLQYLVLAAGDTNAAAPGPADEVTVQYRGSLIDGTEFDSSYARGAPATFALAGVIKGWQEGLQLMKPGARWRLFIPPELAYGSTPRPEIPGGSLLIFDVQLMSVKAAAPAMSPAPAMPGMPGMPAPPGPAVPPKGAGPAPR